MCTTLRPTLLPYKELYCWDGCAQFVSDYLSYEPLKVPNELVSVLKVIVLSLTIEPRHRHQYDGDFS